MTSYDVTMTSYIKSDFFHEFSFLSIWWRLNAFSACNLCYIEYSFTISDLDPLGSRSRSQQITPIFFSKCFFWQSIDSIISKFCVQVASNPANNRLDFETNVINTLHDIKEKLKKNCERCKNTEIFKINTWHI